MKQMKPGPARTKQPWVTIIVVLACLFLLSSLFAVIIGVDGEEVKGNVAVIAVKGTIAGDESSSVLGSVASASSIVSLIEEADANPQFSAIVLDINSGGGAPVGSAEIAQAVASASKPTVAWIRDAGASGAYWVASACDHVIAHPLSVTGSIGVQGSYLEFSGLLDDYNVTYTRLVGGQYKDTGSSFRSLEPQESALLQAKIDRMHEFFIAQVAANRNLSVEQVRAVADGSWLLGEEALAAGLVDELGGRQTVVAYLESSLNTTVVLAPWQHKASLLDVFGSLVSRHGAAVGEGFAAGLQQPQGVIRT